MPARSRSQRCSWILAFAGMTMKGTAAGRSAGFDKLMPERFNPIRTDSRSALYARPVPGLEIGSRDFGDGLADDTGAFHGRGVFPRIGAGAHGGGGRAGIDDGDADVAQILHFLAIGEDQRFQRRSEEHTSELQSLMRISYAVFCFKKT